jgi:DNA-binding NarL/FixJ family response regulator
MQGEMPMKTIRTVLVQKSNVLRSQLADFLEEAGITNVTLASDLADLQTKARQCKPQLVVLDIYLVNEDFQSLILDLRRQVPELKVVLTGPEPEAYYARHTAPMGADLYLSEGLQPDEWIKRLASVAALPR